MSIDIMFRVAQYGGVKQPEMAGLLNDVRKHVSRRGGKASLARDMKVTPSRVSEWLNGTVEPSGENALRLKNWVSEQERKL